VEARHRSHRGCAQTLGTGGGGRPRAVPAPWARLVEINVPDLPARWGLGSATCPAHRTTRGCREVEFFEPSGEQRAAILDQALDPTKNASVTAKDADGADANADAAPT